jgi:hypothetical protein
MDRKDQSPKIKEPAVSRQKLMLGAGITWFVVGAFLIFRGFRVTDDFLWPTGIGLVAGFLKHHFIFSRIAKTNIKRIKELAPHKEKVCLFAFQSIQSYLIVVVMITFGYLLRQLPLTPPVLAAIYITIGCGLLLSSSVYFRNAKALN